MNNRPFAPKFLKKLDERWMKKYPLLWSSRIHLVLYYGGILLIPILLFAFLAYFPPLSEHARWTGTLLISIIAIISIIIWLIFLLRFNPFKRYYIEKPLSFLRTFLLYLFVLMFFVSWIFIPQYVGYLGTKARFSTTQIDKDLTDLNDAIIGEAYHKAPEYFIVLKDTVSISKQDSIEYSYSDPTLVTNTITYRDRLATLELKYDSLYKIKDTLFVCYTYPSFNFIRTYDRMDLYGPKTKIWKYNEMVANHKTYEEYHSTVLRIQSKYLHLGRAWRHGYNYGYHDPNPNKFDKIELEYQGKYDIGVIIDNTNVLKEKLQFSSDLEIYFRVVYYLGIGLTMLLFMFRHGSTKAFFLSLLSVFVLFLVTLVMMFAFGLDGDDLTTLLIVYSAISLIIGLTIIADKRKSTAKMIGLNMFYMGTIFIPLLIVEKISKSWFTNHYAWVEIFTFVTMLVLMVFTYRPLYKKWYALPDE